MPQPDYLRATAVYGRDLSLRKSSSTGFLLSTEFSTNKMDNMTTLSHTMAQGKPAKAGKPKSHQVYQYAGQVFSSLRPKIKCERLLETEAYFSGPPQFPANEENVRRDSYNLAFATLKYQALLEDLLVDSGYYSWYSAPDENHGLLMVMLYDLMDRRFANRTKRSNETLVDYVQEMEDELYRHRTKLNAALAKNRIKMKAPSVESLLPEGIHKREVCRAANPTYAWVNQIKASVSEVMQALQDGGLELVSSESMLRDNCFCLDTQCNNILVFPSNFREELEHHELVQTGYMVIQNKSSCLGPHSMKALVNHGDDVIHIFVGSGLTTAHLASLISQEESRVFAFGVRSEEHLTQLKEIMQKLAVKNVYLIPDNFFDIMPNDPRFKNVKAVHITSQCSKSGLTNPIEFIIKEGGDAKILQDLSKGEKDQDAINDLVSQHMEVLKQAMKMARVQAVVYTTQSVYPEENQNVVTRVMEYVNPKLSYKPYRLAPSVLPCSQKDLDKLGKEKYLAIAPSPSMSGCFVAVATREVAPEDALSAADVIARATAKGLMGEGEESSKRKKKGKGSKGEAGVKGSKAETATGRKPRGLKVKKEKVSSQKQPLTNKAAPAAAAATAAASASPPSKKRSPRIVLRPRPATTTTSVNTHREQQRRRSSAAPPAVVDSAELKPQQYGWHRVF